MITAAIVLISLLILILGFILLVTVRVVYPKVTTLEKALEQEMAKDFLKDKNISLKETYIVESFDGYKLHVSHLPAKEESKRFVIISHGYTYNRYGSLKYAQMFQKFGFHCICYDNRGHGSNAKYKCTFGKNESKDLMAVLNDTYKRYGEDITVGLHGESMGTGLSIMALQYDPKIDFIIADCGYAILVDVLYHAMKSWLHLPAFFVDIADVFCRIFFSYGFKEIRPLDYVLDTKVPICFMHGGSDDFIFPEHSRKMADKCTGYKEIHIFEKGIHGNSMDSDVKGYEEVTKAFLQTIYSDL